MSPQAITSPDDPSLPGLLLRPMRGKEDAPALHAVHVARRERDGVDPRAGLEDDPSLEALQATLSQAVMAGEQDRWLVAQVRERVAGYSRVASWREEDGTWVYLTLGWVAPEWRGRGIGTAMLHWAEQRSSRLAALQHPQGQMELAANASSTEWDTTALLLHEGYRVGYTALEMGLDAAALPPSPPMPAGIEVRPGRPEDAPAIAGCLGEAFAREYHAGRFQESYDPAAYAAGLGGAAHDPSLWQLAWAGERLVGAALARAEKLKGEVFDVGVLPAWRRRGIARVLLLRVLHTLRERGVEPIRIGTVAEFPTRACDLYAQVGFHVLKEFRRYRKPQRRF